MAPVLRGEEDRTPQGRASVALPGCSGTLIAEDWVLTAGHCIGGYDSALGRTVTLRYLEGEAIVIENVRSDACYLHPDAYLPGCGLHSGTSCEETSTRLDCFQNDRDYALLHLAEPFPLPPAHIRDVGPPRPCLDEDGQFPFMFRGQSSGTFADPDDAGPLEAGYRPLIRGLASVGVVAMGALRLHAETDTMPSTLFHAGDSGGTFTVETDDEHGPVIAAVEAIVTGPGGSDRADRAIAGLLWDAPNIDWLWSVVDPTNACTLGSTRPCIWGGRTWPDTDGDGLPDIRDLCPAVRFDCGADGLCPGQAGYAGPDAGESPVANGNHVDTDGDFIGDESEALGCLDNCSGDADGDRIFDDCDNCVDAANTDQADCDGNGIGDACEDDSDGDGILDPCDNCPGHANPAQANCNLEAETILEVAPRGDACDPVPCAETQLTVGPASTDPLGRRTRVMNRIRYDARLGTEDADAPPRSLTGRTTLRFCRCSVAEDSPGSRQACAEAVISPGNGSCALLDIDAHDELVESLPWRWTAQLDQGVNPTLVDTYGPPTGSFVADRVTSWQLQDVDIPRWLSSGLVDDETTVPVETEEFLANASVPGVLWTHTPGEAGMPDFDEVPGLDREYRQLASYYWSGGIEPPTITREPFPCFIPFAPFLGSSAICPFCRGHAPQPWLGFPALFGCGGVRFDLPFIQLGDFVIQPTDTLPLSGLERFAEDPGPWIAAAETGRWLAQDGLRYAKLVDGASVGRVLFELGGAFHDLQGGCNVPPCDNPAPLAAAVTLATDAPAPREGHAAVFSAPPRGPLHDRRAGPDERSRPARRLALRRPLRSLERPAGPGT